jgi:hypothetical protein
MNFSNFLSIFMSSDKWLTTLETTLTAILLQIVLNLHLLHQLLQHYLHQHHSHQIRKPLPARFPNKHRNKMGTL